MGTSGGYNQVLLRPRNETVRAHPSPLFFCVIPSPLLLGGKGEGVESIGTHAFSPKGAVLSAMSDSRVTMISSSREGMGGGWAMIGESACSR